MGNRIFAVSRSYCVAVYTAFYHSYSVEASNPLTSFVDFRFKDSLFEEKFGAIHILGFTNLISHSLVYLFDVNCAFLAVSDLLLLQLTSCC